MMIRYPENVAHVLAYKKKEAKMFDNAIKIDQTYRLVALVDPNHIDRLNNPMNLYGRKIQAKLEDEKQQEQVKELANQVESYFYFFLQLPILSAIRASICGFC